jgi:competence protein ComEC
LVVTPLALIGSMLPMQLAAPVLGLAHGLVEALAVCLQWFSAMRYAVWSAPVPPFWMFCWAMCGTLWLLAPRGWPVRWLGIATWIPLLAAEPSHPAPGGMRVTAFDVGQGMALLIETSGHRLLYDTGPAYSPESNAGNRVILPYLRARGISALDGVIVTHSDADHSGGALTVLEGMDTGWVMSSLAPHHAIVQAARQHVQCAAGQHWNWDGVRFEILHPLPASYADATLKPNARGCTLKVTAHGKSMLLAGDIEAAQEAQLLARDAARLRADVLLAPHHGSGTSSTPAFLAAVQPQAAIFQVGHRNRYHHPKQEVFQRYGAMQIQRYRTDQSGAITVDFGDALQVSTYRDSRPRYWHAR